MGTVVQRGRAWRAIVRRQGVARSGTFDTKAEAEVWVAKIESGIRDERPGVAKVRGITVAALFARYAKEISPKKRGCRWEMLRLAALGRSPAFDVAAVSMDCCHGQSRIEHRLGGVLSLDYGVAHPAAAKSRFKDEAARATQGSNAARV
jgi:hypothetical protein